MEFCFVDREEKKSYELTHSCIFMSLPNISEYAYATILPSSIPSDAANISVAGTILTGSLLLCDNRDTIR